jgi:hypothetical protein
LVAAATLLLVIDLDGVPYFKLLIFDTVSRSPESDHDADVSPTASV